MSGWIKLHRNFLNWEWFGDKDTTMLFLTLILKANHKDGTWRNQAIKRGQLITGRKALSVKLGVSETKIRTCFNRLKKTGEITIQSTNKYSIITITNYDLYQSEELPKTENQPASLPAIDQQSTTNKNEKNEKKKEIVNAVIHFLNKKTGKSFRETTDSTRKLISGRVRDGYTLEDFKKVISVKCDEWKGDPKTEAWLTPSTLFRPANFEKYLQQESGKIDFSTVFHNPNREEKEFSWLPK